MSAKRLFAALVLLCGSLVMHGIARSQEGYPNKPVKVIVAIPPGGSVDMVASLVTQRLSDDLGQTFFVENKGGASGMIGTGQLVRSPADGYTLSVIPASFVATNKALFKNLPYDPQKDLAPISKLVDQSMVLVVRQNYGANSVQDLIKLAKESPGKLTFASAGDGTPHHLAAVLFQDKAKVSFTHVPYKGGALAMNDLLAGHVDMVFAGLPEALPHIKTNKLKALGLLSQKRSPVANEIPTMAESGLSGMDLSAWMALVAPANTPQPIVDKLNAAVAKILNGEARTKLHEAGLEASPTTPDQLRLLMNSDTRLHGELLKAAGVQPQ
jgi:tripartite-type tricarboxylate transporter receptor subunit TctC